MQLVFHFVYPRFLLIVYFLLFQRGIVAVRAQPQRAEVRCAHGLAAPPARLPLSTRSLDQPPTEQQDDGEEPRDAHARKPRAPLRDVSSDVRGLTRDREQIEEEKGFRAQRSEESDEHQTETLEMVGFEDSTFLVGAINLRENADHHQPECARKRGESHICQREHREIAVGVKGNAQERNDREEQWGCEQKQQSEHATKQEPDRRGQKVQVVGDLRVGIHAVPPSP